MSGTINCQIQTFKPNHVLGAIKDFYDAALQELINLGYAIMISKLMYSLYCLSSRNNMRQIDYNCNKNSFEHNIR